MNSQALLDEAIHQLSEESAAFTQTGEFDSAIELWTKFLVDHPTCGQAYLERAAVRAQQGEDGRSMLEDYRKAALLEPDDAHIQFAYHFTFAGALHAAFVDEQEQTLLEQAIQQYDLAVAAMPDHPQAFELRGTAYCLLGEVEAALNDLNEAIELRPHSTIARFMRATVHHEHGRLAQAKDDYEVVFELQDRIDPSMSEKLEERYAELMAELLG